MQLTEDLDYVCRLHPNPTILRLLGLILTFLLENFDQDTKATCLEALSRPFQMPSAESSTNGQMPRPPLQNVSQIEHTRHRSPVNFAVNLLAGLVAYTLQPKKPAITLPDDLPHLPALI